MKTTTLEERLTDLNADSPHAVLRRTKRPLLAFHREEDALNTVEALLLIGVAAIILIGLLRVFFPQLFDQVKQKIQQLFSTSVG